MNEYEDRSMPIGLAMMLAEDNAAMRNFARMEESDRQAVLTRARKVGSRDEMRMLVGSIAGGLAGRVGDVAGGSDRLEDPRLR
ncbi:MAG: hypothetical protein IJF49_08635 [Clostridia bacterium]|nr:hypothetical protein [Clostridia bacterium]